MKKKIKCINNTYSHGHVTVGKIYDLVDDPGSSANYKVISDRDGFSVSWPKKNFIIIGCPCGINNCIKHNNKENTQ